MGHQGVKGGKNVLCEKPLALSAEDAKEMFDAILEQIERQRDV